MDSFPGPDLSTRVALRALLPRLQGVGPLRTQGQRTLLLQYLLSLRRQQLWVRYGLDEEL